MAIMDEDAAYDYLDFVRLRWLRPRGSTGEPAAGAAEGGTDRRAGLGLQPAAGLPHRAWGAGGHPGTAMAPDFVRMEGPDDPELQILLAERKTPCAGRVGQLHLPYHGGPDEPLYSADYPGPLTERLAAQYGGVFGFLQGCAGNIWPGDMSAARRNPHRSRGTGHGAHAPDGEALAGKASEALAAARAVSGDKVRWPARCSRSRNAARRRSRCAGEVVLGAAARGCRSVRTPLAHVWPGVHLLERLVCRERARGPEMGALAGRLVRPGYAGMWEWQRRVGTRELVETSRYRPSRWETSRLWAIPPNTSWSSACGPRPHLLPQHVRQRAGKRLARLRADPGGVRPRRLRAALRRRQPPGAGSGRGHV